MASCLTKMYRYVERQTSSVCNVPVLYDSRRRVKKTCSTFNIIYYQSADNTHNKEQATSNHRLPTALSDYHPPSLERRSTHSTALMTELSSNGSHQQDVDVDAVLAEDLNNMTMHERERVFYDLHGVSDAVEETPELVESTLAELDNDIRNTRSRNAYSIAEAQNVKYVTDPKLRLKFLRASLFDAKRAASQLVTFFEIKQKLFGLEKLTKDIEIEDFEEKDRTALESGVLQILPLRDRSGRVVLCSMPMLSGGQSLISRERLVFYTLGALSDDEESQKKGAVSVHINMQCSAGPRTFDMAAAQNLPKLLSVLPIRFVGIHICMDAIQFKALVDAFISGVERAIRVRVRAHFGTCTEVQYELMTFGIPTTVLPLNTEGVVSLEYHKKWIEQRRQIEEARRKDSALPQSVVHKIPQTHDVLFGRDKMAQQHPGNARYLNMIESTQDRYDAAPTKAFRTIVATEILVAIKSHGGLFLKNDGIGWIEAGDVIAKEKVTNAFRSRRRKSAATKQTVESIACATAAAATMQNKRQNPSNLELMDKDASNQADVDVDVTGGAGETKNREDYYRKRASR